jgi:hypothetical protein
MCLMQTLNNYEIPICNQRDSTPMWGYTINFTFINMQLRWLQQQELINEHMTWWLMKIGLKRCLLRLENNMHVLLKVSLA